MKIEFIPYSPIHRERCLEIYKSNIPEFFRDHETAYFTEYLDEKTSLADGKYWCAELIQSEQSLIIGCGGYWIQDNGIARLTWGIIHKDYHLQGYGKQLVNFRLKVLARDPRVKVVRLDTSQHNPAFFEKFGFKEIAFAPNKYAPGLHSHEMELALSETAREKIQRNPF